MTLRDVPLPEGTLSDPTQAADLARKYPGAFRSNPPMLPGTVIPAFVRCGKPNCRCAGGDPHGPYFYHTCWDGDRLRKTYVPKSELLAVLTLCRNRQQLQAMCRENRRQTEAMMRGYNAVLRQLEQARRPTQ